MATYRNSYHWLFFIVQPFFTLIHCLVHYRNAASKNIFWAFTVFFSMTIAVGVESQESDITAYMTDIETMSNHDWGWHELVTYYRSSGEIDVFRIFFSYLLSRFTDNGYILLIFFGIIYGYFFSRNMWLIIDKLKRNLNYKSIILLTCLFLIIPIWNLGGFRFWVGAHAFIYGLLPYLFYKKKKSLIWCFITPFLFHYAYVIPLVILIIYMIFGNRLKAYFIFFILSLIIGEINISQFNAVLESYAPRAFVERSSSYRSEEKVEALRTGEDADQKVWYIRYLNKYIHWPLYIFLCIVFWKSKKWLAKENGLYQLLCFVFLFYGFANILSTLPSGGRYLSIAGLVALSFLTPYIQNFRTSRVMNKAFIAATPFLILFIIVKIRTSWFLFSLTTLLGNPIVALFTLGNNTSINDIIKY